MQYQILGNTDILVSKLCFGGLTIGPLQANLSPELGGKIIARAVDQGVNFIDTADLYNTYIHIKKAMEMTRKDLVISSKSYDYTKEGAQKSLTKALKELDRDYIDIFMLHEQENIKTIKGHWQAIEYFLKQKEIGKIRAFGISTHRVEGVYDAANVSEIEVIHPLININGLGIEDGTREDMEEAIKYAKNKGKGIYAMKPFGGGNLLNTIDQCFSYILNLDYVNSVAIGMQSIEEVDYNIKRFNGENIPKDLINKIKLKEKKLHIDNWCEGCAKCLKACQQKALYIKDGKVSVHHDKCLLCGYCSAYCPNFCIKVV